jgi:hypothetical protein
MPFDGYLTLTTSGLVPARVYVSRPLTSSIQIGNLFLTSLATLSFASQQIGLQLSTSQATIIVLSAVRPDEVYLTQNGIAVGYLFDPSSLGIFVDGIWALNVPPGPTQVSTQSNETLFGPAEIIAILGQMTFLLMIAD